MLIIIFGTTLKLGGIVQGLMYHPKWYEMGVRYWFANWLILWLARVEQYIEKDQVLVDVIKTHAVSIDTNMSWLEFDWYRLKLSQVWPQ